jgi:hypothetical protein
MNEYKDNENQELSSASESSDDDKNYVISTKITDALSNKIITYDNTALGEAPKQHGLVNSNFIIPEYYQLYKHPSKIFKMDYYNIIQDDIRNCRILNEYQLKYIKDLPDELKNELFDIFNECLKILNDLINDI